VSHRLTELSRAAAQMLGLTVPSSLLGRTDEIID
jgi:hypothetical protein